MQQRTLRARRDTQRSKSQSQWRESIKADPAISEIRSSWFGTIHSRVDRHSPQGDVISPLLKNIYLDRFDQYMTDQGIRIVRYADDIWYLPAAEAKPADMGT